MGASLQSGGRRGSRRGHMMSEINVTPFVDVMLVLLIIFMVTAPMLTAGVDIELPESAASSLGGEDEPISVSVNAKGAVFIQETKISIEDLGPKLKAITKSNLEARIFVRGDKAIDYGRVMKVMGVINAAGFSKVALITTPMP